MQLSLQFLGVWYEILRVPTLMEAGASCVKNNYTQTSDGKIHVENELKPL
jgi:lipocalin